MLWRLWWNFIIILDANGNPVTQLVQTVGVTDPSGNPVTGIRVC